MRPRNENPGPRRAWGFRHLAALLLAAGVAGAGFQAAAPARAATQNSCIDCHSQLDGEMAKPAKEFPHSIHADRGLDCTACHGGDSKDEDITAMDPDKGFKGKPTRDQIAGLCASCHANAAYMKRYNPKPYVFSVAEWKTSVHCKREELGDKKVATCTNCHGVHDIRAHTDPTSRVYHTNVPKLCAGCHNANYMKGRSVPTDQYQKYVGSVHGIALLQKGDLSAPACNDCHGNHGAAPPGVKNVVHVCGTCHGRMAELFGPSKMHAAMDAAGMPGCVACHGNHGIQPPSDDWIATANGGLCGECHEPGSKADQSTLTIITAFQNLDRSIAATDSLLGRVEVLGMETEYGRNLLRAATDRRTAARATLHSFDEQTITAVTSEGTDDVNKARAAAESALRDWKNRRVGMGVSVVVILLLIGLLVAKIRGTEAPDESGPGRSS